MINEEFLNIYNNIKSITDNLNRPFSILYPKIESELNKLRKKKTNTILITQLNGIGDLLLISGFIKNIRYNFPDAYIILVYIGFREDIYTDCPYIDEAIPCFAYEFNLPALYNSTLWFCYNNLWKYDIDIAINPHWGQTGTHATFINWLSGAKERIGFNLNPEQKFFSTNLQIGYWSENDDYSKLLTTTIIPPNEIVHDVDRKYWLLSANDWKIYDKKLEIWLNEKDNIDLNVNNKKIIIGLGASSNSKKYPIRKLSQALKEIAKLDDITFILIGSESELIDAEYLINNKELKILNYVNKLTIKQTINLISKCDLYIGNDTFTVHAAKIYDLPTISMICESEDVVNNEGYGALSSYLRFKPWQMDCKHQSIVLRPKHALKGCANSLIHGGCCQHQPHCITQIQPGEIVEAYARII